MFPSARWKAYLRNLQDPGKESAEKPDTNTIQDNVYRTFHSQQWFLREDPIPNNLIALEHLSRCDALLRECTAIVDALEETLANTPKPSEVLDWYSLW